MPRMVSLHFTSLVFMLLLPELAHADFLSVGDTQQDCCGSGPYDGGNRVNYFLGDIPGLPILSSGPNGLPVIPVDSGTLIGITSGPLIGSAAGTSIYGPGTMRFSSPDTWVKLPDGTACTDFGWQAVYGTIYCDIGSIGLTGTTGLVTVSLVGNIHSEGIPGQVFQDLVITTPVTFDITPDFAVALGISTGPYVGSFELLGVNETGNDGLDYVNHVDRINITGFTPEPTSLVLLGTVVIGVGFAMKLKSLDCSALIPRRVSGVRKSGPERI